MPILVDKVDEHVILHVILKAPHVTLGRAHKHRMRCWQHIPVLFRIVHHDIAVVANIVYRHTIPLFGRQDARTSIAAHIEKKNHDSRDFFCVFFFVLSLFFCLCKFNASAR